MSLTTKIVVKNDDTFMDVIEAVHEENRCDRSISKVNETTDIFEVVDGCISCIAFDQSVLDDVMVCDYTFPLTTKKFKLRKSSRLIRSLTDKATKLADEHSDLAVAIAATNALQNSRNRITRFTKSVCDTVHESLVNTYGKDANFVSVNTKGNPLGLSVYAPKDAALLYNGETKTACLTLAFNPTPEFKRWLKRTGFVNVGTYRLWVMKDVEATSKASFLRYSKNMAKALKSMYQNNISINEERLKTVDIK